MNGYQRDELIGHSIDMVNADPYTQAGQTAYLKRLRDKGTLKYEVFHRRKNGDIFPIETATAIIKVGERELVIGIDRDITERKHAEQALQEYNLRLETEVEQRTRELHAAQEKLIRQERLATLGQLAGSIGHELRNPLGVIANAVYFLKISQPEANAITREYLDIIDNETRTSDKIVTDLLDFTRIKSINREAASVFDLIAQTLKRYPAPAPIQAALEIPASLPKIYVDPQHIMQVLGNLMVNAYQAMDESTSLKTPDGSIGTSKDMQLTVSAIVQSDKIRVAVRDTGMGIPPENMGKLFEPLFTTKTKGIGLGLAVSKKLIEANGGQIEVASEPGQGSTFTLVLPNYKEAT
jgi:signal transduction histidine kinase